MMNRLFKIFILLFSIIIFGCSDPEVKLSTIKSNLEDPNGNFVLYVSNQSFSLPKTDIRVEIDGVPVIHQYFEVQDQHKWIKFTFMLSSGTHHLIANSIKSDAKYESDFIISDKKWSVLDFCTRYEGKDVPAFFDFIIKNEDISFM